MNDIISINRQFLNMAREASKLKSGEILTGLSRPMLDWIGKMSLEQIESLSKDIGVSAINLRLSETEMDRLLGLQTEQKAAYSVAVAVTNRATDKQDSR